MVISEMASSIFSARPREGGDPGWIPAFAGMSGLITSHFAVRYFAIRRRSCVLDLDDPRSFNQAQNVETARF
jgi:hypothetical protein